MSETRRSRSPSMGVTSLQASLQPSRRSTTGSLHPSSGRRGSPGILRIDVGIPRRSSGTSVEFRDLQPEPPSPQPSVDRLSVTFAEELGGCGVSNAGSDRSDSSVRGVKAFSPADMGDKVRFPQQLPASAASENVEVEEEDDDYSASVNAIIQRRNSTRRPSKRRHRRASSPFSPDAESANSGGRRRSSVFTTSSADTAMSCEDGSGATQEQIFERLRLHKEVLQSARQQPWAMRRKMKLVRQAKFYVRRHEGALQERLAHSRTTRDMAARANILLLNFWQHLRRELANFINYIVPWESRIKEIESHFGSAVASYFTFLRWLFWVNLVITIVIATFVAVPELLASITVDALDERKSMLPEEQANATDLATLWDFEGVLRYSPMFYGFYSNRPRQPSGYRLPFAYFMTSLAVYVYSFVATLRRMAKNSRMSKLSEKADDCVFTWKLFTGWDYMIGNAETAHNRTASIVLGFKEALLEEREKVKDARNWKRISLRVLVNFFVLALLGGSAYAVVIMVQRSEEAHAINSWWRQNEVSVVLSLITYLFPTLFEILGIMEQYHPRKQLRLQLARIMVLNLMNLYTLILALFGKINKMTKELESLKPNTTIAPSTSSPITSSITPVTSQFMNKDDIGGDMADILGVAANVTAFVLANTTTCYWVRVLVSCTTTTSAVSDVNVPSSTPISNTPNLLHTTTPSLPTSLLANNETELLELLNSTDILNTTENPWNTTDINNNDSTLFTDEIETTTIKSVEEENNLEDNNIISSPFYMLSRMVTNVFKVWPAIATRYTTISTTTEETSTIEETTNSITESSSLFESSTTSEFTSEITTAMKEEECWGLEKVCPTTSTEVPETTTLTEDLTTEPQLEQEQEDGLLCEEMTTASLEFTSESPSITSRHLDLQTRRNLRRLCWETMFGQELVKLTVMDLVMTVATVLLIDFIRALFVRTMNHCWCWDLEKQFPQYGDFKIAENILQLVHNQGMVWMGMFFSPGLPALNLIKLVLILYLRSWAVLTCNVPHEVLFRASRSNNFYLALLLTMLFLCVLPVSYAIVWLEPSWHCGPFSQYTRIFHILTQSIRNATPKSFHVMLEYVASPGIVIPLLVLLVLIIYYLMSLTSALREANVDLKVQLRQERTEERRKMFQMVDRRQAGAPVGGNGGNDALLSRWRKIIPALPKQPNSMAAAAAALASGNVLLDTKEPGMLNGSVKLASVLNKHKKEITSRRRGRGQTGSDEEESVAADNTDVEQQDSLPEDPAQRAPLRHQTTGKSTSTTSSANRADIPVITISKTESQDRLLDSPQAEPQDDTETVIEAAQKDSGGQKAEPQQPSSPSRENQTSAPQQPDLP